MKPSQPPTLPAAALEAARRGQLIEAIKLTREATGLGLREAKNLVDRALETASTHPGAAGAAPRGPGLAPGEVARGGLSGSAVAIVAAVVGAVLVYLVLR